MQTIEIHSPAIVMKANSSRFCSDHMAVVVTSLEYPNDVKQAHKVRLTLHNLGSDSCNVNVGPRLEFSDAAGKPLPIRALTGFGWHHGGVELGHGPAQQTIDLLPNASASLDIQWNGGTNGPVCLKTRSVRVNLAFTDFDLNPLEFRWNATVCGGYADDVRIEETDLKLD